MEINSTLSLFDIEQGGGLIFIDQLDKAVNDSEVLALVEAKKYKADAVYFRRFQHHSYSAPQIYIYQRDFSDEELIDVHTKLWSSGIVPLFYIVTDTQVKIFNCTKSIKKYKRSLVSKPLKVFSLIGDIQEKLEYEKYSTKLFDNGTFWEINDKIIDAKEGPYSKLLNGLLNAKKDLETKQLPIQSTTINKLLIIGILVRYLEEKEDGNGVKLLQISRDLYRKFPDCEQFTDILRTGALLLFLDELDDKFNGKIFDLSEEEKAELENANLAYIAAIFDGNIDGKQYVLWELYAFNYLPIELISGIYEAFLKKKKGVVYTPPYLVNALIDECMPLYKAEEYFENEEFKILDPACGSGIFLVAALKRMIQWKAILNYKEKGIVIYPDIQTIQRITRNNIFGIDIEEGATLISIFSLCIALCDKLSPMEIWDNLRFDENLAKNNIRTNDFFIIYNEIKEKKYDLVIGNPPFNPPDGFNNKSYLKHIKSEHKIEPSHPLNDDNIGLFFLDKTINLRKKGGKLCFILPASAWLYNNNSIGYRSYFMEQFRVSKIIDFTHLSDRLFHGRASVAVCATLVTDMPKEMPNELLHIVVKRSKVAEERFSFEIDHYDFHKINYQKVINNPLVWKANLLGGKRLLRLLEYLGNLRSLEDYLEDKKENNDWDYGEGYIIGHKGNLTTTEITANGRTRRFYDNIDWITNKPTIDTNSFKETGEFETYTEIETLFEWPRKRKKAIFQNPHILIKANLGKKQIPMIFSDKYLCFKDKIIGIHAPSSDRENLKKVFEGLRNNMDLYRFNSICRSGQAGISMSSQVLLKKDIMSFPFSENKEDLELGFSENIIKDDVLNYYINSNQVSGNSPLNHDVKEQNLEEFGKVFCDILNPIYAQKGSKWFVQGYQIEKTGIVYIFCYGKPKKNILPSIFEGGLDDIERLLHNKTQRNVRINRVLREYLHIDGYDVLIFIKPKNLRYWLKSIALRDADETFADLKRNGF